MQHIVKMEHPALSQDQVLVIKLKAVPFFIVFFFFRNNLCECCTKCVVFVMRGARGGRTLTKEIALNWLKLDLRKSTEKKEERKKKITFFCHSNQRVDKFEGPENGPHGSNGAD